MIDGYEKRVYPVETLTNPDVIVVGAGVAGLTAAALLAQQGMRVIVVEQHYLPGGYCTSWERGVRHKDRLERYRYIFDGGVHDVSGLGEHGTIQRILQQLGIQDRLQWRPVSHEYILPGLHLKIPPRVDETIALLSERFPDEQHGLRAFFAEMRACYDQIGAMHTDLLNGEHPTTSLEKWRGLLYQSLLDQHLHDSQLKRLLGILTNYITDDRASLTVPPMASLFGYYFGGGCYPIGGAQAIADTLFDRVRASGGVVRLRTAVERILVEGDRAVGVVLAGGEEQRAPIIISNVDIRTTFTRLVGSEFLPAQFIERIANVKPSASAFTVFLGVNFVPEVAPQTMLDVDGGSILQISVPSKCDPSLATPGHASVTLMRLVSQPESAGWDRKAQGYAARKHAYGDTLVALAEQAIPNLKEHIVYRQDGSPATFGRYNGTTAGAVYGSALEQWHPSIETPLTGLYLTGIGVGVVVNPGVEFAMISGALTANLVLRYG